jgi:hypothetical protein
LTRSTHGSSSVGQHRDRIHDPVGVGGGVAQRERGVTDAEDLLGIGDHHAIDVIGAEPLVAHGCLDPLSTSSIDRYTPAGRWNLRRLKRVILSVTGTWRSR